MRFRCGLAVVLVRGPSMEPLLRDGDCLLVRRGTRARPGDVVLGSFADRPGLLVVKRVAAPHPEGWLLASDNASAPGAAHGLGQVRALVLARWWPLPPLLVRRPPLLVRRPPLLVRRRLPPLRRSGRRR